MSQVVVELYWADWCGYCIKFKPIWNEIVKMAKTGNILKDNVPIDVLTKDYIHTKDITKYHNPAELNTIGKTFEDVKEDMIKMDTEHITSYPTIKINNVDYNGPREKQPLLDAIIKVATPMSLSRQKLRGQILLSNKKKGSKKYKLKQKGGSKQTWEYLYNKYKLKYLTLKQK